MASAEEAATIQLLAADNQENDPVEVAVFETARTSAGAKAHPTGANATALDVHLSSNVAINERGTLILRAKGHAADTVESEESNGSLPVKLINKSTGKVYSRDLKVGDDGTADFAGFNSTNDVVLDTTNFNKLGTYTVPDGFQLMLDPSRAVHLYLGDDTA